MAQSLRSTFICLLCINSRDTCHLLETSCSNHFLEVKGTRSLGKLWYIIQQKTIRIPRHNFKKNEPQLTWARPRSHLSPYFLACMIMNENTNLINSDTRTYKEYMERHETRPITKTVITRTLEAIREIKGTLDINNKRQNKMFKVIHCKWAKVLVPASTLANNLNA